MLPSPATLAAREPLVVPAPAHTAQSH